MNKKAFQSYANRPPADSPCFRGWGQGQCPEERAWDLGPAQREGYQGQEPVQGTPHEQTNWQTETWLKTLPSRG